MATYFGKPPGTPFDLPGTYITPEGNISSGSKIGIKIAKSGGSQYNSEFARNLRLEAEARDLAEAEAKSQTPTTTVTTKKPSQETLQDIGGQAVTQRWGWVTSPETGFAKSGLVTGPALTRNIGESQAAFNFRAGQVGGAIVAEKPNVINTFEESLIGGGRANNVIVGESGELFTELKYKSEKTGTEFVVGKRVIYDPRQVQNVYGTRTDMMPKFDTGNIVLFPEKQKFVLNVGEDVTRQGTISEVPGIPESAFGQKFVVIPPTKIEELRFASFKESSSNKFSLTGQAGGFVAGFGTSIVGTYQFGKGILTQPVETVGRTAEAIINIPKSSSQIGNILETEPAFALGFVGGELAQFYSPKLVVKGIDIFRTRGLKELPSKDIIASEYFKGQKYPSIKRGQTVGDLLGEFKPKLPGETRPAGFTAAPKPFDITQPIGRGSSELPGLYQAPELSPAFLKVIQEEQKLVSLDFFGQTLKPTIFRITPEDFSLTPGLKTSQRVIQPQKLSSVKEFFEVAPKGKSYIPFIKTEKEAIIPFGTSLQQTAKRFFIKFEGRRIPIYEFETVKKSKVISNLPTASDISKSLSSSRVGRTGLISPSEILSISSSISKSYSSSKLSSYRPSVSKSLRTSYSYSPSRGYRDSYSSFIRSSTSYPRKSYFSRESSSTSIGGGEIVPVFTPPKKPPIFQLELRYEPKRTDIRTKRIYQRTPSYFNVYSSEFGLEQIKVSELREKTGLSEREYRKPQLIEPLGPFKVNLPKKKEQIVLL